MPTITAEAVKAEGKRARDGRTITPAARRGENALEVPKLKEFAPVTIKAAKVRRDEHTGQVTIKGGELVA